MLIIAEDVEEGVVPGGEVAYLRALPALERLQIEEDRQGGGTIIKRALEEAMGQIALNAGVEGATVGSGSSKPFGTMLIHVAHSVVSL
jgi:chaperonin GroEL (HSP60 family)